MNKIDCVKFRDDKLARLKSEVEEMDNKPALLVVQVGDNPASNKYVANKVKRCEETGIECTVLKLDESITEEELINTVRFNQYDYSAIIVQEPLPKHINSKKVNKYVMPKRDCDGLTMANIGSLHNQNNKLTPATPQGVVDMFDYYNVDLTGKEVLIVGRSILVGRPLAELMLQKDATVTVAHSKTKNLQEKISSGRYDIIVACIGQAKFLKNAKAEYLIDVGINFMDGKMCGDFDIESAICNYYTSVPQGVGQLTVATVVENVIKCHKLQMGE